MQKRHGMLTPIFGIRPEMISAMVNRDVVEEHIEEVSFQWVQHVRAVSRPDYSLDDLAELGGYVDANLEGIFLGNETAWQICESLIEEDEEYIFPAAALALMQNNVVWQKRVLQAVNDDNVSSLIGALGWIDYSIVEPFLGQLLASQKPFYQYIALSAYGLHRKVPPVDLHELLKTDIPLLKCQTIRIMGELKLYEYLCDLHFYLTSERDEYRFEAAWSLVLIGERTSAIPVLMSFIDDSEYQLPVLQILLRICDRELQQQIIDELIASDQLKPAVIGAGIMGYPEYIPWLIDMMDKPELARLAGEAFSSITGIDLKYEDLVVSEDEEILDIDDDEDFDDEDEALDEYEEDLYIPLPTLVSEWWKQYQHHFNSGCRYLCGEPINQSHLLNTIQSGFQRQRISAALELALLSPGYLFFETKVNGRRQKRLNYEGAF